MVEKRRPAQQPVTHDCDHICEQLVLGVGSELHALQIQA